VRKYVRFIGRNRELHDEVMEREVNYVDIHVKDGKENTPFLDEELRRNRDDTIELNACNEAADVKCTIRVRNEDIADYPHQEESGGELRLKEDLCETADADSRDPRRISEVDLKKLNTSNNLEREQKEGLIEVLLTYLEFLTTKPGKYKVCEYKFNVTDTIPIIGYSRPVLCSARASTRVEIVGTLTY
jgi:hypothetical protein